MGFITSEPPYGGRTQWPEVEQHDPEGSCVRAAIQLRPKRQVKERPREQTQNRKDSGHVNNDPEFFHRTLTQEMP
jgi:hypothetical protein